MYDLNEINGEKFLLELCKSSQIKCRFQAENVSELESWKKSTKASLTDMLGLNKIKPDNSKAELIESVKFDIYRRDKYVLPTAENLKMTLYVLVPDNCTGKSFITIHGHGCYGKEGITGNIPEEIKVTHRNNAIFALELVQRGYIAVCPDLLGSGERMTGLGKDRSKSLCDMFNDALYALGLNLQGVMIFELLRLIDFTLGLKENKYDKVGSLGFSGGGILSLWLAALSDNVDISVVSGYFHTLMDTCLQSNYCGCNFLPELWTTVDCGELAALASPKPMYIECGDEDNLHGRSGVQSIYAQLEKAKKAYALLNGEENIKLEICEGPHTWFSSCYEFLDNKLK